MSRAGLFVALLLAGAAPAAGDPGDAARLAAGAADSRQTFDRPIDLSAGFHLQPMPPADEDAHLPAPRQPESLGSAESPARPFGLPRPGIPGMMSKREHVPTFRLEGVTLFGGSIAGSADGRSAHVLLTWPTSD